MPFSESTLFAGRSVKTAESSAGSSLIQDIRRSQSAPLNVVSAGGNPLNHCLKCFACPQNKLGLSSSRGKTGCGAPSAGGDGKQSRMYENMTRGSEPMRDFQPFANLTPAIISAARKPPASCLVAGTPLRVPVVRTTRPANQSASRSHLYSPSISQIVDSGPVREIFHLNPTTRAENCTWKSIDEEDEMMLDQEAGRSRQRGVYNPFTTALPRQQSITLTTDARSDDPLNEKVVVL